MPSTTSTVVSRLLPSSTVITPSLPTFWKQSAMISPIERSLLAEIAAMLMMSSVLATLTGREIFFSSATTALTAASMPRLIPLASYPATMFRSPAL